MFDWKKYRLSYTDKALEILHTLTLEEKIFLMSGSELRSEVRGSILKKRDIHYNEIPYRAGGIEEKGIPPMLFADGTRGVVCGRGVATCFPVAVMRGASFLPELEEAVGEAMAEEVVEAGGNLFGGVCVNLPYHPGWGRAQETYGEDPYLLGEIGTALIRGVQKKGVIACVKHFAFNSMENARFKISILCSKRTEKEVFLPHFRKCVEAGAGAVMSAYNSYQGVPCGQQAYLLNQVLKTEWGFDGFVLSDFVWGVKDTAESARNGLDMEMPVTQFYGENLVRAVKEHLVDETQIDQAALRIIRTLLAHQNAISEQGEIHVDYKKHQELALRCAREGMTLLRNEGNILPLKKGGKRKSIVVLGELADRENIGDRGSSQVYAPYVTTILDGIAKYKAEFEVIYYEGKSAAHCRRLAKEADVVLIVAGNDYWDEGECVAAESEDTLVAGLGGDRVNGLGLKERDLRMIHAVGEVRKDAVVALIGGSTISMSEWKDEVGAIVLLYYPGMEGGTAFAELLLGEISPGGKLPFTIPEKEEDLPLIDWDAEEFRYEYYHGYTRCNKKNIKPLYPFGFGLSYTTFRLGKAAAWREAESLWAAVTVQNTGRRNGSEVVQMYVGVEDSEVERPEYILTAFQKIYLQPGESAEVTLSCKVSDLDYYDEEKQCFVTEDGVKYNIYIGTSSLKEDLQKI